jgi:hypothetical protein
MSGGNVTNEQNRTGEGEMRCSLNYPCGLAPRYDRGEAPAGDVNSASQQVLER